ncbi:J domain-containing protein [Achromobacter aloeverae]|uniref:Molecular chaperone DnaJ n=1 Tax=Achromobacter aloeverae TaxID=1750518 RepID=A0A4Q1HNY6_9BURK|nr:J domain-containing protein [Achromobacter aloeverae]RXN92609.1 molecular chaperone DnaJ [Achromobacter aloeverae]
MDKASVRAVDLLPGHGEADLSAAQQLFRSLTEQIQARRACLRAWETMQSVFHKQYVESLLPLARESTDLRVKMVYRLNEAYDSRHLAKSERRALSELIAWMAEPLVAESGDAGLKAIHNMHAGADEEAAGRGKRGPRRVQAPPVDPEQRDPGSDPGADPISGQFSDEFGDEFSDEFGDNFSDTFGDEFQRYEQAETRARLAREAAKEKARAARQAARKKSLENAAPDAAGKSPHQAAALLEAARAQASKSLREVYRKLASALHPDREPDPQERVRKTALMQEANRAYEKRDLLKLLSLRLEVEQVGQGTANGVSEDRLQHYNQILTEQLADLDEEIRHVEEDYRRAYGIRPSAAVTPDSVLRCLRKDIASLHDDIRTLSAELRLLEDIERLKHWLRDLRAHPQWRAR